MFFPSESTAIICPCPRDRLIWRLGPWDGTPRSPAENTQSAQASSVVDTNARRLENPVIPCRTHRTWPLASQISVGNNTLTVDRLKRDSFFVRSFIFWFRSPALLSSISPFYLGPIAHRTSPLLPCARRLCACCSAHLDTIRCIISFILVTIFVRHRRRKNRNCLRLRLPLPLPCHVISRQLSPFYPSSRLVCLGPRPTT